MEEIGKKDRWENKDGSDSMSGGQRGEGGWPRQK